VAEVRLSPLAVLDLDGIRDYIRDELFDAEAAERTVDMIVRRLERLERFPSSGPSLSGLVGHESAYRYLTCGNYIAFYRYETGFVNVIRILYSRRDFMRVLFGPDGM